MRIPLRLSFFCARFVVLALLPGTSDRVTAQGPKDDATYRGGLVSPPLPKPRFTLTDTSGAAFDFRLKTEGYVTLLFFGYANCPDVCPLHMVNVAVAFKKLPSGFEDQIKLVFVTTDPARDSAKALRSWLDHFDKRFIGLTGNEADIEAAQLAAGLPPAKKSALANGDYGLSHSSFVLAYTKDNLAHLVYPGGMNQQGWVHDLPQLVRGVWSKR
jgi:protein SCO1/2